MANSLRLQSQDVSVLEVAILQAAAYADIFDYPLTATELHRYLVGVEAPWSAVQASLEGDRLIHNRLSCRDGYFTIRGREPIVETRLNRAGIAARTWPRAYRYGSAMARLPFVRMVAVTGALSVDNVDSNTDIDYLVVTAPGRLWLCRAFVIALVRLAARRGDVVCPNYFLTERALTLTERSIFTAHELVQMVPISGLATYRGMCQLNTWAGHFLPNAYDQTGTGVRARSVQPRNEETGHRTFRSPWPLAEAVLLTGAGTWLEGWEMGRKLRKFGGQGKDGQADITNSTTNNDNIEVAFGVDRCKGHFDQHGQRILQAFAERLRALDLPLPDVAEREAESTREPRGGCS